jgi:hypothetical protein
MKRKSADSTSALFILRDVTFQMSFVATSCCFIGPTELYRINREYHRFLGNEAESQQHFVAFAAPSSGQIWQIY